jgi:hypothetical protein
MCRWSVVSAPPAVTGVPALPNPRLVNVRQSEAQQFAP